MRRWIVASALVGPLLLVCSEAGGQTVEVPTFNKTVRLEIARGAHHVSLFRGATRLNTYPIATGRSGWETPLGRFYVQEMLRDPAWEHPLTGRIYPAGTAGNELGHYWIGFIHSTSGDIGFHGTPHPETVGKSVSHGCVRMYDKDIELLFRQVSIGTVVSVVP